ncbi:MAG: acyltransferase [Nostocoides sp.]
MGQAETRRGDIQGLRALAVAAVIGAHVAGWPRSGYLGVDVFFVISGFVITGVLLRSRPSGPAARAVLWAFYARRARRILPLAVLVLIATVVAAHWAFAPGRVAGIRTDALWAAAFVANWHFAAVGADYFNLGAAPSPLQHYWSLGVEEQFYLLWPALFLLARRRLVRVLGAVVVGSLGWAAVQGGSDPPTAYFSSLTRAWELGLGALLALLPAYAVRLAPRVRPVLSWLGVVGIVGAVVALPGDLGAPYPSAVFACVATGVTLLAGVGVVDGQRLALTDPVSGYLGDISYGLYLWHFPLLVVGGAYLVPGSTGLRIAVVVGTVAIAAATRVLIERPFLTAPGPGGSWAAWWARTRRPMLAGAAALVLMAAAVPVAAQAFPSLLTDDGSAAAAADNGAVPPPSDQPSATTTPMPSTTPSTTTPTVPTTPKPTPTYGAIDIPLGATGATVQAGLRGGLAARVWPSDAAPLPGSAPVVPTGPTLDACVATVVSNPRSCTFGDLKGPEIDVYGDSLGIPLLTTVITAYGTTHKVRGLTKLACAVNGVDANYGKPEWAIPCNNHRTSVIAYVKQARPAVLLMTENYAWSVKLLDKASGAAAGREWLAADQTFVDAVTPYVGRVLILSPSMPGVGPADCYRPGGSPGRCVTGIPAWWKTAHDWERKVVGATVIDTVHWYCVDGRCPLLSTNGDIILKNDYLHASVPYARSLAPDLAHLLSYAGVIPTR